MSLKRNIIANYGSQIYLSAISILLIPIYIKYMGAEAYGLIGFFSMLQAWFNLLDLGLSPTISRESARYYGGTMPARQYLQLFRALNIIFLIIAAIGGSLLFFLSDLIATRWLRAEGLPHTEVVTAIQIMAVSVALRWISGLYRGVVSGAEKLVWLSGFTTLIATLRFVGVLGSMWLWGYTPQIFFLHQLIVAGLEVFGLYVLSLKLLPKTHECPTNIGWSLHPVKPIVKFALTIAFTSSVWILVTQTDKLILSGILPLAEYGYFTLAVLVANGISVISGPISGAIMPRMARLLAENKEQEVIRIYRQATQWVSIISGSAAITLYFCAEPLLFSWSGDHELAINAAPILKLYALGNGFLSITAFPYYLQYAKGNLRLHLIGSAAMVALLIPGTIFATLKFGAYGAGWVWLSINGLYLIAWLPYVHKKLVPGLHWKWLWHDSVKIQLPAYFIALTISSQLSSHITERLEMIIYTLSIAAVATTITAIMSRFSRTALNNN